MGDRFETCLKGNFLKLDLEKDFFRPFEERCGKAGEFIGLGKNADAAVHFAANTHDPVVMAVKDRIIEFIIGNQLPDGYTGFFSEESRLAKEWDLHEMGFIVQALMADWELFGNRKALESARRNVDYVLDRWKSLPDGWGRTWLTDRELALGFGFGVARLYAATKDRKYLSFLRNERTLDAWNDPIVIGRDKMLHGQAYGYTGTCLEQLELYGFDPSPRYLETSLRVLDFQTRGDGVLIDGNGGICECWTNDQDGEGCVGETCNVTYELLLWDALYRLGVADRSLLGDLMERAVYNALFAAMSEDGRRLRYYTPLNGERKFWPNDLYCCPNNFRRAMSRLPEYLFYADDRSIAANLYTDCEAEFTVGKKSVRVREETDYPKSGIVRFTIDVDEPTSFDFKVRVPRWSKHSTARVNGQAVAAICRPGRLLELPRVWRKGDCIELDFPMAVRTVRGRKRQSGRFAVMRGPVVYAMNTREVKAFADKSAHEVQSVMMMDPKQLEEVETGIRAVVSTAEWAVGVADMSVDQGKAPKNVCAVLLKPFWHEKMDLTYYRAPNIEADCREDDELFGPHAVSVRCP